MENNLNQIECSEQNVAEQPVAEQPVVEQPVAEQPVVEQPVAEQPVVEQPVVEQIPVPSNVCTNCGAELLEDQEFCTQCGQRKGLVLDTTVSSAIAQFNEGLEKNKKNKKTKIALFISIPCSVLLIAVILFSVLNSFGGEYLYVSGSTGSTYTFEDGEYEYDTSDDDEEGTYKVSGKTITIIDEDGDETEFIRVGKYITQKTIRYDEDIDTSCNEDQTLTKSIDFSYKGYSYVAKVTLRLYDDGSYSYSLDLVGTYSSSNVSKETGNYEIDGDKLILKPSGKDYEKLYLIIDDKVHDSVYEKQ